MYAIIADIHGNLEALTAVLDAIKQRNVSRIICLGDVVCYGPDSIECVRQSREWDVVVSGDWDAALLDPTLENWNPVLRRHIEFVRGEFERSAEYDELRSTIESYREQFVETGVHFVHGTPCDKHQWIFPETIHEGDRLDKIASQFEIACFCGHTHLNGVIRRDREHKWEFTEPAYETPYDISCAGKKIVTVGSVGQPRDDDPRASFATVEDNFVTFHRVAYDVETTIRKIKQCPLIDDMFGDRLRYGR